MNECPGSSSTKPGLSLKNRTLFFAVAWVIVLLPFLFWRSTWFGRPLSDASLDEYLHDSTHPRHIQHALIQVAERIQKHDPRVSRWYPDLARLADYPVEEIRNTDAWAMGQDPSKPQFHEALLKLLKDSSPTVRNNAALSLVSFGDKSGRDQITSMLKPVVVQSPGEGRVSAVAHAGDPIRQGTVIMRITEGEKSYELRSPITGFVREISVKPGQQIRTQQEMAVIEPGVEQVWEALRALYVIGDMQDLPVAKAYQRQDPKIPERVRRQANLTEKAILSRASQ